MLPFLYPEASRSRRHGPLGYTSHQSFRPWLRDEFAFRCVYCLIREQWGKVSGEFDIEHFHAQTIYPEQSLHYENLLFACRTCNLLKGSRELPDPFRFLTHDQIRVHSNGTIEGLSKEAMKIIRVLGLDSDKYNHWRKIWIRNIELALDYDQEQFVRLMSFPDDLPNLTRLQPPDGNSRPEGVDASYYALRERGELPETYC